MVAALQSLFSSRISYPQINFFSIKNKTIESCQSSLSFLKDSLRANLPGLLALGYDVLAGNQILSTTSATFAYTAATAAACVVPPLVKKCVGKVLSLHPMGIFLAARIGNNDLVEECIRSGANIHFKAPMIGGRTPLYIACCNGHVEVVETLIAAGVLVNTVDVQGRTPLHAACNLGHIEVVETLIASGAQVNVADANGDRPLHDACCFRNTDTADVLLREGAQVNARSKRGMTPLNYACMKGEQELVRLLLKSGASLEIKDDEGYTPLYWAVLMGHSHIARILLQAGADPFVKDNAGISLPWAALKSIELLKILTGTEKMTAFASCKDVHDFFAVLFPPSLEELPANWEDLVASIEKDPAMVQFIEEAQKMEISPSLGKYALEMYAEEAESYSKAVDAWVVNPNRFQIKPPEIKHHSVHDLLELMLQKSLLFKKAWEIANREEKIRLEEHPDEVFHIKGESVHEKDRHADYNHATHTIRISENGSCYDKITGLIFETINALQRKSFQKRSLLAKQCVISREGYALLTEKIELNSSRWKRRIREGNPDLDGETFLTDWKESNIPYAKGLISHVDGCRRQWDYTFGADYLGQNQGWFLKRLQELQELRPRGDYKAPIDAKDRKLD